MAVQEAQPVEEAHVYIDYARAIAGTESPFPTSGELSYAFELLRESLPETEFPQGERIDPRALKPWSLLHLPETGSLITAASGNDSTEVKDTVNALMLGVNMYETPPEGSGLDPEVSRPFIRFNRALQEQTLRERAIKNATTFFGVDEKEAQKILEERCPVGLLWLTTAVVDAMERLNIQTGGKLLDENGVVKKEYQDRVRLIHADSGAGEILGHHRRTAGGADNQSLYNVIVGTQTGFVSKLLGIPVMETITGACAASGKGMFDAEEAAASRITKQDIYIIMSQYDGPTEETLDAFKKADIPTTNRPPYLYIADRGYTEASAGAASIFITKRFADEIGIPLQKTRLIRTETLRGDNVYGADGHIFERSYRKGFKILQMYYPKDYTGSILFETHGVNTAGWPKEFEALRKLKKEFFPNAHFIITSTQPLISHSYATRSLLSLEASVMSAQTGVVHGMLRAYERLHFVGQEPLQNLRRDALGTIVDREVKLKRKHMTARRVLRQYIKNRDLRWSDIKFGGENEAKNLHLENKAKNFLKQLKDAGITICFTSMKIPGDLPIVALHTGLGGEASIFIALPISERRLEEERKDKIVYAYMASRKRREKAA